MRAAPAELLAGVALDLALGDPRGFPHPVRAVGWWAARLEAPLRRWIPPRPAGILFWFAVVVPATAIVWLTMSYLPRPWIAIYWIYSLLAIRSLDVETTDAIRALEQGDLVQARKAIAMVVGRDTAGLDQSEILRAAIETVAENLSDAVVAPLFYLAIAGPAGMAAYKAVNTLDSTVGYRNDRYRDFGWWSARADDWANLIPARLTAVLLCICALAPGLRFANAVRITRRDAATQPSPNSGWPEAALAGALGVRLGGVNYYRGVRSVKVHLGDPLEPLSFAAYRRTRCLLYAVAALAAALVWSVSE